MFGHVRRWRSMPEPSPPLRGRRGGTAAFAAIAAFATLGAACGGSDEPAATTTTTVTTAPGSTTVAAAAGTDFSGGGPGAVGVVTWRLPDGDPVVVWYPADAADVAPGTPESTYPLADAWGPLAAAIPEGRAPSTRTFAHEGVPVRAGGPFPVIVFSHGWASDPRFQSRYTSHVASWGFVVAAPLHAGRSLPAVLGGAAGGDTLDADVEAVRATLDLLAAQTAAPASELAGAVDLDRVVVAGHSAGGRTAGLSATDPRVDSWIGIAPVPPVPDRDDIERTNGPADVSGVLSTLDPPDVPSLLVAADGDVAIAPGVVRAVYEWLPAPARLVVLARTGHSVLVDVCTDIQAAGGLAPLLEGLPVDPSSTLVRFGENGCLPSDAPVADVLGVLAHLTVAHARAVAGIDAAVAEASLAEDHLRQLFPGLIGDVDARTTG